MNNGRSFRDGGHTHQFYSVTLHYSFNKSYLYSIFITNSTVLTDNWPSSIIIIELHRILY